MQVVQLNNQRKPFQTHLKMSDGSRIQYVKGPFMESNPLQIEVRR